MSKTNEAWIAIIDKIGGGLKKSKDSIVVTGKQIKEITKGAAGLGQQEPRLMTKFDTRKDRPKTLSDLNYTILPIENGTYNALRGDGYHDVEPHPCVEVFSSSSSGLSTIPPTCSSESQVIDSAHAAGLLHHFFWEKNLALTIRGRLRADPFDFEFNGLSVTASGVQVEVDGGYEGDRIYLIEAKMGYRGDFLTRQLYYPVRMWGERVQDKEIVPVFMTYSDKIYYIYEYRFVDINEYNSIELVKAGAFEIDYRSMVVASATKEAPLTAEYLLKTQSHDNENRETPYPQANSIQKVIDYIDAVGGGLTEKEDIAELYGFDVRQVDYYGNAAKYLGFLERCNRGDSFSLTEKGDLFYRSQRRARKKHLIDAMLESPSINEVIKMAVEDDEALKVQRVRGVIGKHRPEITGDTLGRRASTIVKWVKWALENIEQEAS